MMRITTMAIFLSVCSYAQKNHSINGVIKDQDTGEIISGASIKVKEKPEITIETNEYGFYSISLPESDYTLIINHNKHGTITKNIHLYETVKMDLTMEKEDAVIEEVLINKKNKTTAFTKSKMGAEVLDIQSISKLPVLFGEKDVIKTLQFLPGISSQEGSSGFSVRGGSPDQNLILLDEAPIFNNSHLLGFFSTFNSDALRSVSVYKGNMPSQYGGRLSSIIDVKMKEGNNQDYNVTGGIGLISSRLSVEGPIQKGKSSFIISGRRTYADLFVGKEDGKKTKLYFYDLNAKANFQINNNNSIHLSTYFGKDVISYKKFKNNWGNIAVTLRWNSIISSKLFSNTSFIFSNYNYKTNIQNFDGSLLEVNPNIRNLSFKQDFNHYIGLNHSLRYGLQSSYYYFNTPGLSESVKSGFLVKPRSMWENALYINDDFKITDKFFINYGVRLSMLSSGEKTSETEESGNNNFAKSYTNLEPRLMLNYEFNKSNSLRIGYTRNTQNIQTLSSTSNENLANDLWINLRKPETADQINIGYTKKFKSDYEISIETFYKKMSNLVDYKDGVEVNVLDNIENNLLYNGHGRAYGLEFLAKKTSGRLTGWLSYTLSKTERKIDGINDGEWYNAQQDKTHNLSIVTSYQLTPKWTLSGAFVYSTGNAVTFPVGRYESGDQTILQYGKRNSNRMPAYHRLDINATYEPITNKRFKSSWSFGIYNVYGRSNPFSVTFQPQLVDPNGIQTVKTSLFSIVPNVTYNFKF
ncbi:collagen-binding protein [Chryseobacterium glaciei]|uniref:Collagen-binding protein n=1 Tax=Chryseobacterium glaciei TaxID=1685010 RepID=A0A172XV27_9FLAO|nr:TonB-dependent receptor [Chryseobacterium glaciei]ANF50685.1 collagen-binding protein [Chryseobacterium glaciei]